MNHRACIRVATDPEDRNSILEELPLSTRVHELAKELGLKSAELLERIQNWGLDVKASNFASLDSATVDRIKDLSAQAASGSGPVSPPQSAPVAPAQPRTPPVSQAPPVKASPMVGPAAKTASAAPVSAARPRSEPVASGPTAASQVLTPGSSPAAAPVAKVISGPAAGPVASGLGSSQPSSGARPGPGSPAPLSRHGGFSSSRSGGGPLSAHTPHRGIGGRPESPSPSASGRIESRVAQTGSPGGSATGEAPGGFQPLKPGDYMSSAGIRTMTPRVTPAPPSSSMPRREAGGDSSRRESGGGAVRKGPPLPQVAAANAPRPSTVPRPAPPGPALKTHAPDKSMTKDELLKMMKSGQLGHMQSPGGATARLAAGRGPGIKTARARFRDAPRPGSAPPSGGPAMRRGPGPAPAIPAAGPLPIVDDEEEKKAKAGRLGSAADRAGRRRAAQSSARPIAA